ncbi:hypothetical protein CERSUDRAFT_112641 [Gelatoporia subvermispora B]|uniref:Uncharacterized protein n=1 Tax=Ceriporiopsis subvermispora (strain B) TaxID=914234 RepID=M2RJI0_CERS8|nr:hypothetical protein CERSUDRAFT_112641 [Gelatoporia subvermispora B]
MTVPPRGGVPADLAVCPPPPSASISFHAHRAGSRSVTRTAWRDHVVASSAGGPPEKRVNTAVPLQPEVPL